MEDGPARSRGTSRAIASRMGLTHYPLGVVAFMAAAGAEAGGASGEVLGVGWHGLQLVLLACCVGTFGQRPEGLTE